MKKTIYVLLSLLILYGFFLLLPSRAFAQCDSCAQKVLETYTYDCTNPDNPLYAKQCTTQRWVCYFQYSGGGGCTCCYENQCVADCGGGAGGGGGGGEGPGGLYCGDGTCSSPDETCSNCPGDCGACPTTTAKLRGVAVPETTNSCDIVNSATSYVNATFSINNGANKQSSGATYAEFDGLTPGGQMVTNYTPSSDAYVLLPLACYTLSPPGTTGNSNGVTSAGNDTITWNVAFSNGVRWVQTQGGDVYAASRVQSYVQPLTSPRYFDTNGAGGSPGVVTYGAVQGYNFGGWSNPGEAYVSSKGWLINETYNSQDYYAIMVHRFGDPQPTATGNTDLTSMPATGPVVTPSAYFYDGNVTVDTSAWNIPAGQGIVVMVSGNLTINKPIRIASGGFAAFIVKGDISVDTSVGVPYTSSAPSLQGMFITSPTGTFHSGLSTTAAARRLVVQGTVIAGNFDLERDLDADGVNSQTSSELFIYDPSLLLLMPQVMEDLPTYWQEVAP